MAAKITRADVLDDARLLGCSPAAVLAVAEVESNGSGFNADGTPKILFEGHWFSKYTKGIYDKKYPTISYPTWTKKFYGANQTAEYERLRIACLLDRRAALMSTSFGGFQVMGFNFGVCGYLTVDDFYQAMCKDANSQLEAFTQYVIQRGLADELRDLRWADFARLYNGARYAENNYDTKLAAAYKKYLALEPK